MSHALLDQIKAAVTPSLLSDVAKALNEPGEATDKAIGFALPALISALAAATRMPQGLSSVLRLVEDPVNDGTLSTQLASLYQGTMVAAPIYRLGSQLLQAVVGNRQTQLAQGIAALSGVRPASATALLHVLAPHLIDIIGTDHRAVVDSTPEGFARYMERQKAHLERALAAPLADILNGPAKASAAAVAAAAAENGVKAPAAAAPKANPSAETAAAKAPPKSAPRPIVRAPAGSASSTKANGIYDKDSHWDVVFLIAFSTMALFGLAFGLLGTTEPRTQQTLASKENARPAAAPATAKALEAKPAEGKPSLPAAVAPAAPPLKAAEPAPAAAAKDSPSAPVKPAKPGEGLAAGSKDAGKDTVKKETKAKVAAAAPAPIAVPSDPIAPAVPGVTKYYGTSQPLAESRAVANPDYKPATSTAQAPQATPAPAASAPSETKPPAVPGVTAYYGTAAVPAEQAAVINPDYKPITADAGSAAAVPPDTAAPALPGVTTYYGSQPSKPETPAAVNPDYKPAARTADATPAPGPPAAASETTPKAGIAAPADEALAKPKPDLTAAARPSAAIAAAADGKAAIIPPAARATITTSPSKGVTTYYGSGTPDTKQSCADTVAEAVKSGPVLFHSGSADLTASSLPPLKRIAKAFRNCQGVTLRIEGHTDDKGSADLNQKLSEARARSVVGYLTLRGVDAAHLSSAGYGMSKPLVPNTTEQNRSLNRRIEFAVDKL